MTTLGEAIRTLLLADATFVGLTAGRVYPLIRPQARPTPAVTYQEISGVPYNQLGGKAGAVQIRLQVSAWAETYEQAFNVSQAVLNALEYFSGESQGVRINMITFQGKRDLYEEDSKLYHQANDYSIMVINP